MNKTMEQLYEEYRDKMKETLGAELRGTTGRKFTQSFEQKVERLDSLIALFSDLIITRRNESSDTGIEGIFFDVN